MSGTALSGAMAAFWNSPLATSIEITRAGEARTLATLAEANDFVSAEFGGTVRHDMLMLTVEKLMRAAETGNIVDRQAATVQLLKLLRFTKRL